MLTLPEVAEQAPADPRSLLDRARRLCEQVVDRRASVRARELEAPLRRRQQVVQLLRDPAGHHAEALALPRLHELLLTRMPRLLRLTLLGDVDRVAPEQRLAAEHERELGRRERPPGEPLLEPPQLPSGDDPPVVRRDLRGEVRREDVLHRLADHLRRRDAGELPEVVAHPQHAALGRRDRLDVDVDRRVPEERREQLGFLGQLRLPALVLVDVGLEHRLRLTECLHESLALPHSPQTQIDVRHPATPLSPRPPGFGQGVNLTRASCVNYRYSMRRVSSRWPDRNVQIGARPSAAPPRPRRRTRAPRS